METVIDLTESNEESMSDVNVNVLVQETIDPDEKDNLHVSQTDSDESINEIPTEDSIDHTEACSEILIDVLKRKFIHKTLNSLTRIGHQHFAEKYYI